MQVSSSMLTKIDEGFKMFHQMFVLLMVATTGSTLAIHREKPTLLKITPDPELGDIETKYVRRGKISTLNVKNDDGELFNTEILSEEGYAVVKPEGVNVCYVKSLEDRLCAGESIKVPNIVAERCGDRTMYALIQCQNEGEGRSKRSTRSYWSLIYPDVFCGYDLNPCDDFFEDVLEADPPRPAVQEPWRYGR